jgi:hypothetical protein
MDDVDGGSKPPITKWAIAAFALSLVGGSLIAAWFAFKALVRVKEHDERGRGLAIAAMVLAFVVPCTVLVVLDKTQHWAEEPKLHEAATGECFNTDYAAAVHGTAIQPFHLKLAPCDQPHNGEVVGVVPNDEAHRDTVAACELAIIGYVLDPARLTDDIFLTASSFNVSFLDTYCFAATGSPTTGSLKADVSAYDDEQVTFLRDTATMQALLWDMGELTDTGWVDRFDGFMAALDEERDVLSGETWSAKVRPAVKRLTDAEQRIRQTWWEGRNEGTVGAMMDDARTGLAEYAGRLSAVRRALGLPTMEPQWLTA